jgi:hypothetical protein
VTGSHTYAAAGIYTIVVEVTDDDLGSGTATLAGFNNYPTLTYPLPPIMPQKKGFNIGSAIPVKIRVVGCTAGLAPRISVTPASGNPVVSSKGKSNLADYFRYTPGLPGFIYNWNTTGWATGTYTVRVTGLPGSVVITTTLKLVK